MNKSLWGAVVVTSLVCLCTLDAHAFTLAGTYPILEWDGELRAAGNVQLQSQGEAIGFIASPLSQASFPVPALSVLTPAAQTTLDVTSQQITQTYKNGVSSSKVVYVVMEGYTQVTSTVCSGSSPCDTHSFSFSTGGAFGVPVDAMAFFSNLPKQFTIEKAGPLTPVAPDNQGALGLNPAPQNGAYLELPFCYPGWPCDANFVNFPYAQTKVFAQYKGFPATHAKHNSTIYAILVNQGTQLLHYSLDAAEPMGGVVFRNFQYKPLGLTHTLWCLEDVLMPHIGTQNQD